MDILAPGDAVKIRVRKFDPEQGEGPYYKEYLIPYTQDMRVLEALDYIVEEIGESLSYRWFCGVKKCGMCGMQINGRAALACWEPVKRETVVEPLANFSVVRDLVIDRSGYESSVIALKPWLQREQPYPGFPEPLQSAAMSASARMSSCIECLLCVSACPAQGDQFLGPAPLVQLARYAFDTRDMGARGEAAHEIAGINNCVSCYQCSAACPMDIAVFEEAIQGLKDKAGGIPGTFGIAARTWFFANIHLISGVASNLPHLVNGLFKRKFMRWLLEKLLLIDRRRPIPEYAETRFDRMFEQRARNCKGSKKVVLFHDTFMTYFEPEIGIAATELLEAAGYEVILADSRKCCGRPHLSANMRQEAARLARHNIRVLSPFAEAGVPIVGCEPSCVVMVKKEYPRLCGDARATLVANNMFSLEEFLVRESEEGTLGLAFSNQPKVLLVHDHCHQKYHLGVALTTRLFGLFKGSKVEEIPTTCCGMAGSNGFECEHYERSLRAAEVSLFPAVRNAPPDAEIIAAGASCRQQIHHGTGRIAHHPATVLHRALKR